jgi:hypothetical protein
VTAEAFENAITFSDISYAAIKTYISSTLHRVYELTEGMDGSDVEHALNEWRERPGTLANFPERGHNCLTPNHMTLMAAGVTFQDGGRFMPPKEADYISAILETARAVLDLRANLRVTRLFQIAPPQPGLILTAPSLYRHFYDWQPSLLGEVADPQIIRKTIRLLRGQRGFQLKMRGNEAVRMLESEPAKAILGIRADEAAVHTLAVGLRAASTVAATIRLPPSVNRVVGQLEIYPIIPERRRERAANLAASLMTYKPN